MSLDVGLELLVSDHERLQSLDIPWQGGLAVLDDLLLELGQSDFKGVASRVESLGRVPAGLLFRRPSLPLVKEPIDLFDLALQPLQLGIIGIALLDEFLGIFVQGTSDRNPLLLLHGHVLLEVPGFHNLDGGEDHVLAHPEVLLLPERDHAVVVALQLLGRLDGLGIGRRQDEHGAGRLARLATGVADLPLQLVRVVLDGADLVLLDGDLGALELAYGDGLHGLTEAFATSA